MEDHTCAKQQTNEPECNCKGPAHGMRRHFITKAEKMERLKEYAEQLKKELQGVEEKIRELRLTTN